jgi:hypothetical protein
MSWEDPEGDILVYDENVITFGVGQGYCYIKGTTGYGSGLSVAVGIVTISESGNTESSYLTSSIGVNFVRYHFVGAALLYRDPDNPGNPIKRVDGIGDGLY